MIERRSPASLSPGGRYRRSVPGQGDTRPGGAGGAGAGWGALRAWSEATIAPGAGLPPALHTDVEIVTCVREGALTHEDDLGNHGRSRAGDVQVMSAGSGLTYAEFNADSRPARLLQLWLQPDRRGYPPSWGRKSFPGVCKGRFVTLASGIGGDEDALPIRSDARVLAVALAAGQHAVYRFAPGSRRGWLLASRGGLAVNGLRLHPGEAAAITHEMEIDVAALEDAEGILVDTRA